ncbi:hypothetical protein E4U11_007260 [Claviceps purpurea]|nr:hypothetical protein E4U11_007260 [Claviceps purpurea]
MDSDSHQETGDDPDQTASREAFNYRGHSGPADCQRTPTESPEKTSSSSRSRPYHPSPHYDHTQETSSPCHRDRPRTRGTVLFPAADNLRSTERRVQLDLALLGSALRKVATAMEASTEALPEGDAKTIISGFMRDTVARMSQLLERGYSVTPNSDLPQLALPIRQSGRVPFQTSAPAVAVTASVSAAGRHTAAQPTNQHKRAQRQRTEFRH